MFKDTVNATLKRCGENPLYKAAVILEAAWAVLLAIGFFVTDLGKVDLVWVVSLAFRIGVIVGIAIFHVYYFKDLQAERYRGYKAFAGYAVVFSYIASGIVASARHETGGISAASAWIGWAAAVIETAPGLALYFFVCSNKARVAFGVLTQKDVKAKARWKPPKAKTIAGKILDNVDAVLQAIILVAIIHSTLFQLYVIPSESMVPKFLIGDRVIVTKLQSGPRVPLSPLKLPSLYAPKRGDIIVYENPFSKKPPVLRRMLNTLVFYLTLSSVNLDKENGTDRVGTVVKRLVGMPGEKLLMVDDALYSRKPGEKTWSRLGTDATWARTDLWKEDASVRGKIRDLRITAEARKELDGMDAWKSSLTIGDLVSRVKELAAKFGAIVPERFADSLPEASRAYVAKAEKDFFPTIIAKERNDGGMYYALRALIISGDVQNCLYAISNRERMGRFIAYLAPPEYPAGMDPYEESSAKLNLSLKIDTAERWLAYMDLLKAGDSSGLSRIAVAASNVSGYKIMSADPSLDDIMQGGEAFRRWILLTRYFIYYDYRNFPEYPNGTDAYIPEGQYFLMGDNRYNSLDFRFLHDESARFLALDAHDPESVRWVSALDMSTLPRKNILGKVLLTFWPPSSIGR
jgi:signal peptidase I